MAENEIDNLKSSDPAASNGGTFREGLRDGLAIGLGYLSVSFSFGILAVASGLSWWQAVLVSATNITSAGQVAGVGIMASSGGLIEMMASQIVINLRYSLMAISLSQKTDKSMSSLKRALLAYGLTDEGDKLAGTRIIPLVIEKEKMERAKEAGGGSPLLHAFTV